jgi:hypothetical protein
MSDYLKNMAPQYWEMTPWGLQFNQMRFAEAIIEECGWVVDNAPPAVVRFTPYLHKYFGITNEQTN